MTTNLDLFSFHITGSQLASLLSATWVACCCGFYCIHSCLHRGPTSWVTFGMSQLAQAWTFATPAGHMAIVKVDNLEQPGVWIPWSWTRCVVYGVSYRNNISTDQSSTTWIPELYMHISRHYWTLIKTGEPDLFYANDCVLGPMRGSQVGSMDGAAGGWIEGLDGLALWSTSLFFF